jgi:hypothetical protein
MQFPSGPSKCKRVDKHPDRVDPFKLPRSLAQLAKPVPRNPEGLLLPDWGGQLQRFFWIDKEESGSSRFFFGKSKKIVGVFHPNLEAIIYYYKISTFSAFRNVLGD